MKKTPLIIFLMLFCVSSMAQQWTLEQCINYALEHNIKVKQAAVGVESSRLGVEQAKFDYLPTLNASAGYNKNFGRPLDQTTNTFTEGHSSVNGSLSLGMSLFGGLAKMHTLQKNRLNLLASITDEEYIRNNISLAVAASYLQILYGKERVDNHHNQIKVLEEQLSYTKLKVQAGSIAIGSQLELEAQLANEHYNLVATENVLRTSLLELTQLLELNNVDGFDITSPDIDRFIQRDNIDGVEMVNEQAQNLPQIRGAELRMKAAAKDVSLARSKYYPSLSMGIGYGSNYSNSNVKYIKENGVVVGTENYPFWEQLYDFSSTYAGLSMQIPIFNGLSVRRSVSQAKLGLGNNKLAVDAEKNELLKNIQNAHNDAVGAKSKFMSARTSLESSTESFRNVEQKFANGAATVVEYITAKNLLITAESTVLQAKYELAFALKVLDFYAGKPLTLDE